MIIWVCFESAKKKRKKKNIQNTDRSMQHQTGFWIWEEKPKEKRQKGTPLKIYNVRIHALPFEIVSCKTKLKCTKVLPKNGFPGWRSYCSTGFTRQRDYERAQELNGYILTMKIEHLHWFSIVGFLKGTYPENWFFQGINHVLTVFPWQKQTWTSISLHWRSFE